MEFEDSKSIQVNDPQLNSEAHLDFLKDDILLPKITESSYEQKIRTDDILMPNVSRQQKAIEARVRIFDEYKEKGDSLSLSQLPCKIKQIREHLKEIEPMLRSLCTGSSIPASESGACRWICTARTLGVKLSDKALKQQCSHLFPVDSCAPLVGEIYNYLYTLSEDCLPFGGVPKLMNLTSYHLIPEAMISLIMKLFPNMDYEQAVLSYISQKLPNLETVATQNDS